MASSIGKALPAPEYQSKGLYVAPRTPTEETLAAIWADVLKLDRIGIYDNFFEIGGHSLLATQVVSRIRTSFRIELPLRALFETPTITGLSLSVGPAADASAAISRRPQDAPVPLSFAGNPTLVPPSSRS